MTMSPVALTLLVFLVFAITVLAVGLLLRLLCHKAILDHPNHRSSHAVPTPKGGGLAVMAVLLAAWTWVGLETGQSMGWWAVPGGALALAILSWWDDLHPLPAALRLGVHLATVVGALLVAPLPGPVLGGWLPPWADLLGAAMLWVWFVNLYNFMDGIDGLSGVETGSLGAGLALLAVFSGITDPTLLPLALAGLAAALGFLIWNRPPAKIFLGDVGSVPLGFLFGWLLLSLGANGYGAAALILPGYYLADASITILKRAVRGENVLQAHREHFYQLAVRGGLGHGAVVVHVALVNGVLIVLAVLSPDYPVAALGGAVVAIGWLLYYLRRQFVRKAGP
ncbi:glycosyltransferase family 4 protein [Magnetospira sp. QH-2]|uniref:MraY family glycosyltransferase n=1 Tax=Magnetospira sp. (strain QH-2) TaxID=1288970 RepID=UPI0003E81B95|nr:glycosyltransferase family 4 protein [Magnetospira sp. QH-2]CCQ75456.1 putative Glycosyl transferase, famoly 4 protein [Magnetospira sp. QH-2]